MSDLLTAASRRGGATSFGGAFQFSVWLALEGPAARQYLVERFEEVCIRAAGTRSLLAVLNLPEDRMLAGSHAESRFNRKLFHHAPHPPKPKTKWARIEREQMSQARKRSNELQMVGRSAKSNKTSKGGT